MREIMQGSVAQMLLLSQNGAKVPWTKAIDHFLHNSSVLGDVTTFHVTSICILTDTMRFINRRYSGDEIPRYLLYSLTLREQRRGTFEDWATPKLA